MFSIRKPAETIVIDILANEMQMHERDLLQEANEKMQEHIAHTISVGHTFLAWLLLHNKDSFRRMLDDMERRHVVIHTEKVILDESEWDDPRRFVTSRIYELRGNTRTTVRSLRIA